MAQFKRPKQLAFQPLQQALASPGEFLFSDFSKLERPGLLHVAFQALDAFQVSPLSTVDMKMCTRIETLVGMRHEECDCG